MIQFDPTTHVFTLNGAEVPSVTRILKCEGWIDTRFYSEDGRTRGEYFHKASALVDTGHLDWRSLDEDVVLLLLSYEKAKAELKLKTFTGIERIVYKGNLWAGIEDRSVKWKGRSCPLELKSGAYEMWHKLQVAGYGATYRNRPPYSLLLYLNPKGYKLIELTAEDMDPFYMAWHQTVSLYHFRRLAK